MCGPPWSCARGAGPRLAAGPVSRVTPVTGNPPTTYQPPPDRRCRVRPRTVASRSPSPPERQEVEIREGPCHRICSMGDGWSWRASRARRSWDSSERRSRPGPCRRRAGPTIIRPQGSRTGRTGTTPWSRRSGNHAAPRRTPRGRPGRRNRHRGSTGTSTITRTSIVMSAGTSATTSAPTSRTGVVPGDRRIQLSLRRGDDELVGACVRRRDRHQLAAEPARQLHLERRGRRRPQLREVPPQALEGRLPGPQLLLGPQLQHDPDRCISST